MINNDCVIGFLRSSNFRTKLKDELHCKIGKYEKVHQDTTRISGYDDKGYYYDEGFETDKCIVEYYNKIKFLNVRYKKNNKSCYLIIGTKMFNSKFEVTYGCPTLCWVKTNKFNKNTNFNVSVLNINNMRKVMYDIFMNFGKENELENNGVV